MSTKKPPPTITDRCGTPGGYDGHRRRGERPCQDCRTAHAQRITTYRAARGRTESERAYARARSRALQRLASLYPDMFQSIMDDELRRERERAAG